MEAACYLRPRRAAIPAAANVGYGKQAPAGRYDLLDELVRRSREPVAHHHIGR